jgi:hypothetical protein
MPSEGRPGRTTPFRAPFDVRRRLHFHHADRMARAIPRLVTRASVVRQPLQQRQQRPQIRCAGDFRLLHLLSSASVPSAPPCQEDVMIRHRGHGGHLMPNGTGIFVEGTFRAGRNQVPFDRLKPVLLQEGQQPLCRTALILSYFSITSTSSPGSYRPPSAGREIMPLACARPTRSLDPVHGSGVASRPSPLRTSVQGR